MGNCVAAIGGELESQHRSSPNVMGSGWCSCMCVRCTLLTESAKVFWW